MFLSFFFLSFSMQNQINAIKRTTKAKLCILFLVFFFFILIISNECCFLLACLLALFSSIRFGGLMTRSKENEKKHLFISFVLLFIFCFILSLTEVCVCNLYSDFDWTRSLDLVFLIFIKMLIKFSTIYSIYWQKWTNMHLEWGAYSILVMTPLFFIVCFRVNYIFVINTKDQTRNWIIYNTLAKCC